jgi:hypothetical protein
MEDGRRANTISDRVSKRGCTSKRSVKAEDARVKEWNANVLLCWEREDDDCRERLWALYERLGREKETSKEQAGEVKETTQQVLRMELEVPSMPSTHPAIKVASTQDPTLATSRGRLPFPKIRRWYRGLH